MRTLLGILLLMGIPGALSAATSDEPFGRLTVEEVSKLLGKPNVFVFDNNSESMFKEAHVPGAKLLPYRTYPEDALPKNRDATLIFYCKNPH